MALECLLISRAKVSPLVREGNRMPQGLLKSVCSTTQCREQGEPGVSPDSPYLPTLDSSLLLWPPSLEALWLYG